MIKNQLSKREYKYRCKIIAENHLKKDCQKYLDSYIAEKGVTYKDIYLEELTRLSWLTAYRFNQFGKAVYKAGISTSQFIDTMQNFTQAIKPWLEDDIDE